MSNNLSTRPLFLFPTKTIFYFPLKFVPLSPHLKASIEEVYVIKIKEITVV